MNAREAKSEAARRIAEMAREQADRMSHAAAPPDDHRVAAGLRDYADELDRRHGRLPRKVKADSVDPNQIDLLEVLRAG